MLPRFGIGRWDTALRGWGGGGYSEKLCICVYGRVKCFFPSRLVKNTILKPFPLVVRGGGREVYITTGKTALETDGEHSLEDHLLPCYPDHQSLSLSQTFIGIQEHQSRSTFWSLLSVPPSPEVKQLAAAGRTFAVVAPRLRNILPFGLCLVSTILSF